MKYIGLCLRLTRCWKDRLGAALRQLGPSGRILGAAHGSQSDGRRDRRPVTAAFYTAPVVGSPHIIDREIEKIRGRLHNEVINLRRLAEQQELVRLLDVLPNDLRDRQKNPNGYRSREADDAEDAYLAQRKRMTGLAGSVPNPTALLVVDEADRLKMAGLEQIRSIFDQGRIGLILIGMPGLEKRFGSLSAGSPPASASFTSSGHCLRMRSANCCHAGGRRLGKTSLRFHRCRDGRVDYPHYRRQTSGS